MIISDIKIEELQFVINVNLMGVIYCSRKAIKLMKQNDEYYKYKQVYITIKEILMHSDSRS